MTHRLMTIEACSTFGWPYKGIAQRLASHPTEIAKLSKFRRALDDAVAFGLHVLPVLPLHVSQAADLTVLHGLLYNDALIVALMQDRGIQNLASADTDFDRVPTIARYGP
jgi:predicted nucleic acid-binding protein